MVWVGGQLLYGRESVLQKVKPNQCEQLKVKGTNKRICVADTVNPVTNSNQTLQIIRTRLLDKHPQLAPSNSFWMRCAMDDPGWSWIGKSSSPRRRDQFLPPWPCFIEPVRLRLHEHR